jgi:hypothetical protein
MISSDTSRYAGRAVGLEQVREGWNRRCILDLAERSRCTLADQCVGVPQRVDQRADRLTMLDLA